MVQTRLSKVAKLGSVAAALPGSASCLPHSSCALRACSWAGQMCSSGPPLRMAWGCGWRGPLMLPQSRCWTRWGGGTGKRAKGGVGVGQGRPHPVRWVGDGPRQCRAAGRGEVAEGQQRGPSGTRSDLGGRPPVPSPPPAPCLQLDRLPDGAGSEGQQQLLEHFSAELAALHERLRLLDVRV